MRRKVVNKDGRKKAFIGAIVGTVAGIAGDLVSANKKKKAEEAAFIKQQTEQNRIDGLNQAATMTTNYADQSYVDQYKDKITLKAGGKMKIKKGNKTDRLVQAKKFALGGIGDPGKKKVASNSYPAVPKELNNPKAWTNVNYTTKGGNLITQENLDASAKNGLDFNNDPRLLGDYIDGLNTNIPKPMSTAPTVIKTGRENMAYESESIHGQKIGGRVFKAGGRKKFEGGGNEDGIDWGKEGAEAVSGVGGLVTSLFSKPTAPKVVKKSDGISMIDPKTNLTANTYQLDANGQPIMDINKGIVPVAPQYTDRMMQAKYGMRTRVKSK